ncbi:MAG: hypothetical protein ACFB3T_10255 [Geminicoccaceae bacterium]
MHQPMPEDAVIAATEAAEARAGTAPVDALKPVKPAMPTLKAVPDGVPAKFWDPLKGEVRLDALLKSYRELEKLIGRSVRLPERDDDQDGWRRVFRALGAPERAEDYDICCRCELFAPDAVTNARLHQAGMTNAQAQLVYDLAVDTLLPLLADVIEEAEAARQAARLEQHFGGAQSWRDTAVALKAWGERHLSAEVFATLASHADGVLAMYKMMQAEEPALCGGDDSAGELLDEARLRTMMRDPRYWQQRDPAFVERVTNGFRQLYAR